MVKDHREISGGYRRRVFHRPEWRFQQLGKGVFGIGVPILKMPADAVVFEGVEAVSASENGTTGNRAQESTNIFSK